MDLQTLIEFRDTFVDKTVSIITFIWKFISHEWKCIGDNKESLQALGSILSPLAIFTGSVVIQLWISKQNRERFEIEQKATEDRSRKQQELTEIIARRDRDSAIEQLRKETLDSYLNRITSFTEKQIDGDKISKISTRVVRALTIAVLKELDSSRNKQVTTLLYEIEFTHRTSNPFDFDQGLLYGADLEKTNLKGAFLKGADLRNVNLKNADLREANLEEANLSYANLQNASLQGANLSNSTLNNAKFQSAKLSNSNLTNASLEGANLCSTDLSNSILHGTNLRNSLLKWSDLFQAEIIDSTLINANLRGVKLINATLRRSDFSNTFLKYADFSLSELTEINFQNAYLRLVDFRDEVDISGDKGSIKLRIGHSAPLMSGDIKVKGKAKLNKVDFRGACLDSANFSAAIFEDVDLRGFKPIRDCEPIFPQGFNVSSIETPEA